VKEKGPSRVELPMRLEKPNLEMQDNAGAKLEIVLALAKKAGPQ